jgi:hypothetical protein
MSRRGKLGEGAPPEQFQDESHLSSKEAQDKQKGAPLPLKEVQVLLPVMGAAALQLAHAALGCVRIMDTLVTNMNGKLERPSCLQLNPHRGQYASLI